MTLLTNEKIDWIWLEDARHWGNNTAKAQLAEVIKDLWEGVRLLDDGKPTTKTTAIIWFLCGLIDKYQAELDTKGEG